MKFSWIKAGLDIFNALTESCTAIGLTFFGTSLMNVLEAILNPKRPASDLKILATQTVNLSQKYYFDSIL